MARNRDRGKFLATAAIFIILEIAAVGLLKSSSSMQNIWLNRFSHRILVSTWSLHENVRSYTQLKGLNEKLSEENHRLHEEIRSYQISGEDYNALSRPFTDKRFSFLPCSVVKMSSNTQHNYIILNKGFEDGIHPHSGIISSDGVVGIVKAVDRHYAYGLTLMNPKVSISCRIGGNGPVASLEWDGKTSHNAVLKDISLHLPDFIGDTVWTSGVSSIFPGDVPVGTVVEGNKVSGSTKNLKIELFQDLSSIRYVTVTRSPDESEITALEEKEGNL